MRFPKEDVWRCPDYLKWVRSLPSVVSGQPSDDAHHIKRPGFGGTVKCSDLFTIPLTREEHAHFHIMGWRTWEKTYHVCQKSAALRTIERAVTSKPCL